MKDFYVVEIALKCILLCVSGLRRRFCSGTSAVVSITSWWPTTWRRSFCLTGTVDLVLSGESDRRRVSAWLRFTLLPKPFCTRVFFCNQAIRRILENMNLNTELSVKRCIFCFYRGVLFGGGSTKMVDADLSRLYTATSLMQIDDNIMRWVLGNCYMWFLSFSWETDTRRICDLRFVIDHTVNK